MYSAAHLFKVCLPGASQETSQEPLTNALWSGPGGAKHTTFSAASVLLLGLGKMRGRPHCMGKRYVLARHNSVWGYVKEWEH